MSSGYDTSGTFNTYVGGGGARFFQYTSATNSGALLATAPATGSLAVNGGLVVVGGVSAAGLTLSGGVAATGPCSISGANTLEFGYGVAGKESVAGRIGYGTYSGGSSLDIVGAGTAGGVGGNRKITMFAEGGVTIGGAVSAYGGTFNGDITNTSDAGRLVFTNGNTSNPTATTNGAGERIMIAGSDPSYAIGVDPALTVWIKAYRGHTFYSTGTGSLVKTMAIDQAGCVTIAGPLVATCNNSGIGAPVVNPASSTGTTNVGQHIVLHKTSDGDVDYALGMDGATMWLGVPGYGHLRTYVGTAMVTDTNSAGLAVNGNITVAGDFKGMELGAGVAGKEVNAGRIYYDPGQPNGGVLSIVGWGTSNTNRKVMLWAEGGTMLTGGLTANGPVVATQLAATGTIAVGPPAANPTGGIGARVIVWADAGARPTEYPYAIGSDSGQMWYLTPGGDTKHRFYSGATVVADLAASGVAINTALTVSGGVTVSSGGATAANAVMADRYAFTPNRYGGTGDLASLEVLTRGGESTYLLIQNNNDPDDSIALVATGGVSVNTTVSPGPNQMLVGGGLQVTGAMSIAGANTLEFGQGVAGKDSSAGMIGYGTYSSGASLDIVGAGNGPTRQIKLWAEGGTQVTGIINMTSATGSDPTSSSNGAGERIRLNNGDPSYALGMSSGLGLWYKAYRGHTFYSTNSGSLAKVMDIDSFGTTTIAGPLVAIGGNVQSALSPPIANPAGTGFGGSSSTNAGQRVLMWKVPDGQVDFALGMETASMWASVPAVSYIRQYVGTTKITETSATGLSVTGGLTVNGPIVNNMYPIPQLSFTLPGGSPSYNDIGVGAALNLAGLEPGNTTTFGNLLGRAFLGLTSLPTDMPPITMMRIVFRGVALENGGCNVVIEAVQGYYGYPGSWNSIQSAMNPAITSQCQVVSEGSNRGLVTAVTPWFTPTNSPGWSGWDVPQIGLRVVSTGVAAAGTLFRFSEITLQFA